MCVYVHYLHYELMSATDELYSIVVHELNKVKETVVVISSENNTTLECY